MSCPLFKSQANKKHPLFISHASTYTNKIVSKGRDLMILELKHKSLKLMRSIGKMNGGNSNSSKKRSQRLLLLVLALGVAMLSVMLLNKLREGRVSRLLLQDQDRQIFALQLLLQVRIQ